MSRRRWLRTHSTNWKGPVPTGRAASKFVGTIMTSDRSGRKLPLGALSSTFTVWRSGADVVATRSAMALIAAAGETAGSAARLRLARTVSAVTSLPSWNFTPLRSRNV